MKNTLLAVGLFTLIMWTSCGDGNIFVEADPAIQAAEDSATIVNYIDDLGLTGMDSVLLSGVHYVILDSGDGQFIDESDIVSFDYIGRTLNDTIFDTSIKEIADSIRILVAEDTVGVEATLKQLSLLISFEEERSYEPFEITYAASGWPFAGRFIRGFEQGVSATFKLMREGGKALIVIPSAQAYGPGGSGVLIPGNTVIAFELFPLDVVKQPSLDD